MRVGALDVLALHLEDEAQHAVRGRVLRAEVQGVAVHLHGSGVLGGAGAGKVVQDGGGHAHGVGPSMRFRWIFSSPGSVVMASQGERKSNDRKSCVSFTFSFTTRPASAS